MNVEEMHHMWLRAKKALGSARLIYQEEYYEDCVSRAYYAIFHAANATLLSLDIVPRSHSALKTLFGLHLVKTGIIEIEWADILGDEQDQRVSADYDTRYNIDPNDAQQLIDDAERFMNRMAEYLLTRGIDVNAPPNDL